MQIHNNYQPLNWNKKISIGLSEIYIDTSEEYRKQPSVHSFEDKICICYYENIMST